TPECIGLDSVSTVTTTLASPRRLVVRLGAPTAKLPASHTRMASALSSSAFCGTTASSPAVPCSSDPSPTILMVTGSSPASARNAVRCIAMLPLQSAAPRPYQRPSTSVNSHAGVVQRGLHVVMEIQQHGRGAGWSGRVAADGDAAVGGVVAAHVPQARLGERREQPVHHAC